MSTTESVPTFETERLILRPPTLDDAPSYQKYFNEYDIIKELGAEVPWPYPEGGSLYHLRENILPKQTKGNWFWAITLKENVEEVIGGIEITESGADNNRGFWLGKPFWGRGYMSEALVPVTDFCFDSLGMEKMILENAKGNIASRRIKEKVGATFIRLKEKEFLETDQSEFWELTKEQWQAYKESL